MLTYIDGTTGGMMLQIVMAGIVGGFMAIKLFTKDFFAGVIDRLRGKRAVDASLGTQPRDSDEQGRSV